MTSSDVPALRLSPRQLECLRLVAAGKTTLEIAAELGISNRTVEQYVAEACTRLGVRTRIEAIVKTVRMGLISDEPHPRFNGPGNPGIAGSRSIGKITRPGGGLRPQAIVLRRLRKGNGGPNGRADRSLVVSNKRARILLPRVPQKPSTHPTPEPRSFLQLDVTARQLEILSWVEQGKSATDIGGILGISHRTVEHHLEKVCNNLGVRTRFQAVLKVRDLGLIGSPNP